MALKNVVARGSNNSAKPGKKYFSVAEANRALGYVGRVVDDVSATYRRIVKLRRSLEGHEGTAGAADMEREYDSAMDRLSHFIDELHEVGVELKDFEQGLIDFPSLHEGREILLCWRRGEKEVSHWHECDAGFAGRRPVAQLDGCCEPDRKEAA